MIGHSDRVDTLGPAAAGQEPMCFARKISRYTLVQAAALGCVMVVLLAACDSRAARASQTASLSLPSWTMNVPLWKALPTKHFAILGEGVVNNRRWAIFAFASNRSRADQLPCIEHVTLRYEHRSVAISHGAPSCGVLAPPRPTPVTTEYAFTNVGGLVVGMTLDPSVARVKMDVSAGPSLGVSTKLLKSHQAKKAKVRPFRYVALGVDRKACLEALEGIAEDGESLFQTSPQECILHPQ